MHALHVCLCSCEFLYSSSALLDYMCVEAGVLAAEMKSVKHMLRSASNVMRVPFQRNYQCNCEQLCLGNFSFGVLWLQIIPLWEPLPGLISPFIHHIWLSKLFGCLQRSNRPLKDKTGCYRDHSKEYTQG